MSEQTTPYSTPETDAYKALRAFHDTKKAEFVAERTPALNAQSKDALVDMALEFVDVPRSALSKKKAVEEIVENEWQTTSLASELRESERRADNEKRVLRNVESAVGEGSQRTIKHWQDEITKTLADNPYETRTIMGAAAQIRTLMRRNAHWGRVARRMEDGTAPLEAFSEYRAHVLKDFAESSYRHNALSRSTSVLSNVEQDIDNETDANWLADTRPGWF